LNTQIDKELVELTENEKKLVFRDIREFYLASNKEKRNIEDDLKYL
jgi:hypothetical protein